MPDKAGEGRADAERTDERKASAYPANVTYRDLIAENRRKSALLVATMILLAALVGAAAGVALGGFRGGADSVVPSAIAGFVAFTVFAGIASLWSWYGGASAILSMAGAQPIEKSDDPQLFNVVEEIAISAGVPMPKVHLIPDQSLNAFATGRDPGHASIAITTGLRSTLTRDELAGVIAHEMSHVRHYDIRLMMLMATLVGLVVFASDFARRMLWYGGGGRRSNDDRGRGGNPLAIVIVVLSIVLLILAPIVATLIRFAISRQREFLADAGAVDLIREPDGLINALRKLGAARAPLQHVNESIAPLFIVDPHENKVALGGHDSSSIFQTHPPLSERIARLQALG